MPARRFHCLHRELIGLCLGTLTLLQLSVQTNVIAAPAGDNQFIPRVRDLNTPRNFPEITSRREWQARARDIHDHVLVSCGLWPLPQKTPLHAHIFGRIERGDYSIEKVYFETYPGFFLAGNLYRPLGKKGPFPAILNPHGHWSNGRLADEKDGSIAARCISFARLGMIAFSYDMVGYNDTHFADPQSQAAQYNAHREFGTNRADLLWSISLMGLQTWNSIRAVDFLASLPDADPRSLACTGESGGGTQTFMLGAVEDRLALQAPIVMVSHIMQGGCLCENAPGLRVQFSNMEIAAQPAPRPQMLVAATGDWTKDTLTVEGPSIAHIYELLGKPGNFHYTRFDFPHNYNQTTRQAVYGWFNKWLLHAASYEPLQEKPYHKEPDADLRVFPDGRLPEGALTKEQFVEFLKNLHRSEIRDLMPSDKSTLNAFKRKMLPAWRHDLQIEPRALEPADHSCVVQTHAIQAGKPGFISTSVEVRRPGDNLSIRATYWAAANLPKDRAPRLVIISDSSQDPANSGSGTASLEGLPQQLLEHSIAVLKVDHFSTSEPDDQFSNFYCTYNRTTLQNRVRDLVTLCKAARFVDPRQTLPFKVTLIGIGHAGLWSLMAAPAADAVVADCGNVDLQDENALLARDLFCPGILALGGFQTAAILAAPHPLLLHNLGDRFVTANIDSAYSAVKSASAFKKEKTCLSDADLAAWIGARAR